MAGGKRQPRSARATPAVWVVARRRGAMDKTRGMAAFPAWRCLTSTTPWRALPSACNLTPPAVVRDLSIAEDGRFTGEPGASRHAV